MAQDPNKPQDDDDRQRVSQPMDDLSEEATIMLDPAALQRQLQAEMGNMPQGSAAGGTPPPGGGAPSSSQPVGFDAPPPPPPPPGGMPPPTPGMTATGGGSGPGGFNVLAIASLACGILAFVPGCLCFLWVPLGAGAIITGFLAKKKIAEGGNMEKGAPLALAGIICGALAIVLYLILSIVGLVFQGAGGF